MKLTAKDIEEINNKTTYDQGVFIQPTGISTNIKTHVIYMRWCKGYMPGSCWDDEDTVNEYTEQDKPKFEVLDLVLNKLKPEITYIQYEAVENLIQTASDTDYGYYGDYSDYEVEYIILEQLYDLLKIKE